MSINYVKLFKDFEAAGQEAKQEIHERTGIPNGDVRLIFWFGYNKPYFELTYFKYPEEEKVKGVHLGEMIDELSRRLNFVRQQETLQLAAPTIDGESTEVLQPSAPQSEPVAASSDKDDDEIPC